MYWHFPGKAKLLVKHATTPASEAVNRCLCKTILVIHKYIFILQYLFEDIWLTCRFDRTMKYALQKLRKLQFHFFCIASFYPRLKPICAQLMIFYLLIAAWSYLNVCSRHFFINMKLVIKLPSTSGRRETNKRLCQNILMIHKNISFYDFYLRTFD